MLALIIKYYFRFLCCTYICCKISNLTFNKPKMKLIFFIYPILLTYFSYSIDSSKDYLTYIIPILSLWTIVTFITHQPKTTFVASFLSFGLCYSLFTISTFISLLVLFPFYPNKETFPFDIYIILSAILLILLTGIIFRKKRFKKGMPFLFSIKQLNIATVICLLVVICLTFRFFTPVNLKTRLATAFFLSLSLAFLIHWWQAQITKAYKQSLIMRELDSLRIEVEEKDKELKLLKQQNEELGRLIHHDNKRIPAMEHAVCEYLVSDFSNIDDMKNKANSLRLEIESLSRNRSNTLKEIYAQKSNHYTTGINALDTLLNYMANRATTDKIEFNVHNTLNLKDYVPTQISAEDFTHLLSDLLENAIIATNLADSKIIQLQFYVSEKHFVIEVADSGIPFETKSIVNFGLSQLTTHKSTGGSGIGLMDIWKIKEIYGATLHIEEYKMPSPFTKKISLIFNRKNMYSIRTFRSEEITAITKRNDLKIYDDNI